MLCYIHVQSRMITIFTVYSMPYFTLHILQYILTLFKGIFQAILHYILKYMINYPFLAVSYSFWRFQDHFGSFRKNGACSAVLCEICNIYFLAVSDPFWRFQTYFGGFSTISAVSLRMELAV